MLKIVGEEKDITRVITVMRWLPPWEPENLESGGHPAVFGERTPRVFRTDGQPCMRWPGTHLLSYKSSMRRYSEREISREFDRFMHFQRPWMWKCLMSACMCTSPAPEWIGGVYTMSQCTVNVNIPDPKIGPLQRGPQTQNADYLESSCNSGD
jgi:hypothetical protein